MANESLARNEEILDGIYPLGALIRLSPGGALYETKFGEGDAAVPAVISIRNVESAEVENLTHRLRNASQLTHPNLLRIYAAGSSLLNGVPVFYVVMERADESLEAVLAVRALTKDEMQEMLVPALDALDYLHKKGYAHLRLRPSSVLAVNDHLKLSADSIIRAHEGAAAEDMRALGALIVQALTRTIPNADDRREAQHFEGIPQPLADIVQHCLDPDPAARWTAEQVKARLNGPAVIMENIAVERTAPLEQNPDAHGPNPDVRKAGVPKWIYLGLATLVLIVVLTALARHNDSAPIAAPIASATQQKAAAPTADPTAAESAARARAGAASPQRVTPASRAEVPPVDSRPGGRKASGWSVIVAAYGSRESAEKRTRAMTKRWPTLKISIFETRQEKTPYLVVLGQNLSEDEAQALRKRAIESGLPGDTYIKRVM